ncbi:hypothetical protein [Tenacibaculum jejuense]|nr:hypothetical protein [Tenacibaculum jejuense]
MSLTKKGDNGSIYAFFPDGNRLDLASSFTEFIKGLIKSDD